MVARFKLRAGALAAVVAVVVAAAGERAQRHRHRTAAEISGGRRGGAPAPPLIVGSSAGRPVFNSHPGQSSLVLVWQFVGDSCALPTSRTFIQGSMKNAAIIGLLALAGLSPRGGAL